eukprot:gb/GFBE01033502.1/.p1 GENE.gb/GFBE01033502.1/~~gb/GFBE01033502.1/.p1  ORF type:complete len:298 (+),score=41.93 gb/GFBE01033502.1/:1-894(+)
MALCVFFSRLLSAGIIFHALPGASGHKTISTRTQLRATQALEHWSDSCKSSFVEKPAGDLGSDRATLTCGGEACKCVGGEVTGQWSQADQSELDKCLQPRSNDTASIIYLIGDSHAEKLLFGFQKATGMTVKMFAIDGPVKKAATPAVLKKLEAVLKPGDSVAFTKIFQRGLDVPAFEQQLTDLYAVTSAKRAKLVVVKDNHWLPRHPDICRLKRDACEITKAECAHHPSRAVVDKFKAAHASDPNVRVLDTLEHMCKGTTCSMYVPGTSTWAFTDTNHLTEWGSLYLTPFICQALL